MSSSKISINHKDTGELLGFVARSHSSSWEAQTVFGYIIERVQSEKAAKEVVREQAKSFIKGVWQYYDKDDGSWYPCIIKDANQATVIVVRTNSMGYQDPDSYKLVIIESPDENRLVKSS